MKIKLTKNLKMGADVFKIIQEQQNKEKLRQEKYGKVKPIINAQIKNTRCVAVGSKLLYSDKWKTFTDFLMHYLWFVIGEEWFESEVSKPSMKQHYIMKWWESSCELENKSPKQDNGLIKIIPNGSYKAFIQLAYDLYILNHHQLLQDHIINRLKNNDNFQGARYELFATSTMIRAGFEIKFEDETDRNTKHVEFIANHPYHYGREDEVNHKSDLSYAFSKEPLTPIKNSNLVGDIIKAVNQYENIPNDFPNLEL